MLIANSKVEYPRPSGQRVSGQYHPGHHFVKARVQGTSEVCHANFGGIPSRSSASSVTSRTTTSSSSIFITDSKVEYPRSSGQRVSGQQGLTPIMRTSNGESPLRTTRSQLQCIISHFQSNNFIKFNVRIQTPSGLPVSNS